MPLPSDARTRFRALAAVLACVAAASPAAAQTTLGDGTNPAAPAQPVCPAPNPPAPATGTAVDAFTFRSTVNDVINSVRVQLSPTGTFKMIDRVEVRSGNGALLFGAVQPASDLENVYLSTPINLVANAPATSFLLVVVPKRHETMPRSDAGQLLTFTARVNTFSTTTSRVVADTGSTNVTLDNQPPAEVLWDTATAGAASVTLTWKGTPKVVVLRRAGGPVRERPVEGATYATGATLPGGAQVVYAGAGAMPPDATVVAGRAYYYTVFVKDDCDNYSSGSSIGPIVPGGALEGDAAKPSYKAVVGLLNPLAGTVSSPFRVQVRVFSPKTAGGAVQPIGNVDLGVDSGSGFAWTPLQRATVYGTAQDSGIWEALPTGFELAPGSYTLRARAYSSASAQPVYSAAIGLVVSDVRGDGKLLVRDNSSQLCEDCHKTVKTHSSEAMGNDQGSWYVGCRGCHQPHGATNAALIADEITPPAVRGNYAPTRVYFAGIKGYSPTGGAANPSQAAYANGDPGAPAGAAHTGICQVCHTATQFWTRTGVVSDHYGDQECTSCHSHDDGLKVTNCSACHGDAARATVPGGDALQASAPPKSVSGATVETDPAVGEHLAHVNRKNLRGAAIGCSECHQGANHATPPTPGAAEVFFGTIGSFQTPGAAYNPGAATCVTYCHGGSMNGGSPPQPSWIAGDTLTCTSCHGGPPPISSGHPLNTSCVTCHGTDYAAVGADRTKHIDRALDVVTANCTACHGDLADQNVTNASNLASAAPGVGGAASVDVAGNSATTFGSVGAHRVHLAGTHLRGTPIACGECHAVPADGDVAHARGDGVNGARATMTWGALARGATDPWTPSVSPSYTGSTTTTTGGAGGTCASTYCHGAFTMGKNATVSWSGTFGASSGLTCNSCHGAGTGTDATLPPFPHQQTNTNCGFCHGGVYTRTTVDPDLHMNGLKEAADVNDACADCHNGVGDRDDFAVYGNGSSARLDQTQWTTRGHGSATVNLAQGQAGLDLCLFCHDDAVAHGSPANPFRLAGASGAGGALTPNSYAPAASNGNGVCLNCHGTGSNGVDPDGAAGTAYLVKTSTKKVDAWHYAGRHSATADGGMRCWDCHDPHGDGSNIKMIGADVLADSSDAYGFAGTRATGVVFTANATGTDYAGAANKICNACHGTSATPAAHYTKTGSDGHQSGARCTACHLHQQSPATAGFVELTSCTSCHATPPTGGRHAAHLTTNVSTAYGDTAIRSSPTAYSFGCGKCHGATAANHVNDIGGTGADPYRALVTFDLGGTYPALAATVATETGPTALVYGWQDGTCSATACHDPQGASYTGKTAVSWNTAATMTCTSCHDGGANAASTTLPGAHPKHLKAVASGGYAYSCESCHANTVTNATTLATGAGQGKVQHVDGDRNDVKFGAAPLDQAAGTFSGGAAGTCSNTYCHSNGVDRVAPFTNGPSVAWNGTAGCGACHQAGSAMATGAHGAHVNAAAYTGNFGCVTCHDTASSDAAIAAAKVAQHVNAIAEVTGTSYSDGTGDNVANGSCATNYCHSNGTETLAAGDYEPIAWTATLANDCNGCHGSAAAPAFTAVYGEPNYANSAAANDTRNSHARHVSTTLATARTQCVDCHESTTGATGALAAAGTHLDNAVQVTAGAGKKIGAYDAATETCSNISCHGGNSAQWGGAALKCADCHLGTGDQDDFAAYGNGSAARVDATQWTSLGHGSGTVNLAQGKTGIDTCLYCHDGGVTHGAGTNPFRVVGVTGANGAITAGNFNAGTNNGNGVCLNCHGTGSNGVDPDGAAGTGYLVKTSTKKVDAWHYAVGKHSTTADGGMRCWDCHDPHGDGANIKMIGSDVLPDSTDAYGLAGARATGVVFTANAAGTDYAGAATKVCNACHGTSATPAAHYTRTASDGHQSAARCVACHVHQQSPTTNGFQESTSCTSCHPTPPAGGRHASHLATNPSVAYGDATIRSSPTAYSFGCGKCHGTTAANHMNDLGGTGADPYRAGVILEAPGTYPAQAASVATETGASGQLTYGWQNGACSATTCHDPQGASYTGETAVSWNTAAAMTCTSCHDGGTGGTATTLPGAHAKHLKSNASGGYAYTCDKCHANTVTNSTTLATGAGQGKVQHVDGDKNDVKFNAVGTTSQDQNAGTFSGGTAGTCSNTYCHSNGQDRTTPYVSGPSIAWSATAAVDCSSCHGGNASAAVKMGPSNDHAAHMDQVAYLGTNFACGRCHATVVGTANDRAILAAGLPLHVNGAADVSMVDGGTYGGPATKTCSSVYCHSNGTETADYKAGMDWDAGLAFTNDCKACHGSDAGGFTATYGEPNYANNAAAVDTRNSHQKHVSTTLATARTQCVDCHAAAVDATGALVAGGTHLDKAVSVTVGGKIGAYDAATETCSSISCHGGNSAQWGGAALGCVDCHGAATDTDDWTYGNGTVAKVSTGAEWTTYGHGSGTVNLAQGKTGIDLCRYCHDGSVSHGAGTNPFRLLGVTGASGAITNGNFNAAASNGNGVCLNCHGTGSNGVDPDGAAATAYLVKNGAKKIDAWHYGASDHTATQDGGLRCWDCHDVHGDGTNLAMIGSDTLRDSADAYGLTGTRSATPVVFTSNGAGGYANTTTRNGVCQVCHTTTAYWRATSEPTAHNAGTDCGTCHAHQQPPNNAFAGAGGTCTDCHGAAADTNNWNTTDSVKAMINTGAEWTTYGHGSNAATGTMVNLAQGKTGIDVCLYCHDSSVGHATGTNPFRLVGVTGASGAITAGNFNAGTNNGNGTCLNCHGTGSNGVDPDGAAATAYLVKNGAKKVDAWHYAVGKHSTTADGGMRCWDCHDPHGDGTNIKMIGSDVLPDSTDAYGLAGTRATGVAFTANAAGTDYAGAATKVCNACHGTSATPVAHYTRTASDGHQSSAKCIACHLHQQSPTTNGFQESTACNACHPNPPAGGRHASHLATNPSVAYGDATIRSSSTAYSFGCGKCHGTTAANHLNDVGGTGADPYRAGVILEAPGTYPAQAAAVATETGASGQLTYGWQNGTCSATACHDPQGASYTGKTAVSWNTTATLTCTSCHDGGTGGTATTLPGAHAKHLKSNASGGYAYTCDKCHANTATNSTTLATAAGLGKVQHVDGDKYDVKFNSVGTTSQDQNAGTYSGGATGTCSNTYCHSNGQDRATPYVSGPSIAWSATAAVDCSSCHGGNASAAVKMGPSNDHAAHMDQVAYLGTNFACGRCHNGVVAPANDRAFTAGGMALHVNGAADVSMPDGGTYGGPATKTCSNVYCHSNGTETTDYKAGMDWDAGLAFTNDCKACHGSETAPAFTSTYGEPNYTNNATSIDTRNAHRTHVSTTLATAKTQCVDCHTTTIDALGNLKASGTHLDKAVNIAVGGKIGSYTEATETCSNITCHGGNSAQWGGGALTCASCHGSTADARDYAYGNGTTAKVNTGAEWTTYGHGNTTTVNLAQGKTGIDICRYCHDTTVLHGAGTNPFRLLGVTGASGAITGGNYNSAANNGNGVCLNCHGTASNGVDPDGSGATAYLVKNGAKKVNAWHYGADHLAGQDGGMRCWDCHDPHGDGTNIKMIGADTLRDSTDAYGYAGTRSTTGAVFTAQTAANYAKTTTPFTGICQVCHTTTSYWRADGTMQTHNSGVLCTNCHAHEQTPTNLAFKGTATCIDCHKARTGSIPRAAVVGGAAGSEGDDFIRASRHVSNGTTTTPIVTNYDCILCHAEGDLSSSGAGTSATIKTIAVDHGGDAGGATTVDLRDVDSAGGTGIAVRWPGKRLATFTATTAQRDGMDTFCMRCHDSNGASTVAVNKAAPASGMLYSLTTAPTLAQAQKPFNASDTLANARDTLNAQRTVVLDVRSQFNSGNAIGKNFASHHNLNQFTKRYTNANANWPAGAWTAYVTKEGQTMNVQRERAGLHCSDCHLNEANAHGTRNSWYMLASSSFSDATADVAFTNTGTDASNENCMRCHSPTTYGEAAVNSTTFSRTDAHDGDCSRISGDGVFTNSGAIIGKPASGTEVQIACLLCHGGGGLGWIHGRNANYNPWNGATASKTYRFMGTGGSMRFYSPTGAALTAGTAETAWEGGGTYGCYTITGADTYGACTQHNSGRGGSTANYQRSLGY